MAKHNRWSKVKHRKAVVDKRRGKVWTKIIRAVMVAARQGGPDPAANIALRFAMDEARYANIPRDTVEGAIRKATGAEGAENYEPVRYEGYAPGGVAVIVDGLTNNRTRTIADVRLAFGDHGGNVGATGSVGYMFQAKGEILVAGSPEGGRAVSEEALMEAAINAGAEDVEPPSGDETDWLVTTEPSSFLAVKDALEQAGFKIIEAQIAMIPGSRIEVRGDAARQVVALVEALEELDDVQKVYTNAEIPDDELASLA